MKWAILLGSPDISGGTYVIFEHAIRAKAYGAEVTIITEEKINMERLHWHPEAKVLKWKTFEEAQNDVFDICIATWWRTVYELHRINAFNYVYFVQSIESRFYPDEELPLRKLVDSTYHLPIHIVTEAKWIKSHLKEHYNQEAFLVPNGIRKDIYNTTGLSHSAREKGQLRVLVEGPIDVAFKNVAKTVEICKKSLADEVWLLTSSPISSYPGVDKVFSQVPIFETANIYRSCDVIIKLSYVEGMFGPPLEMFHCGGTSITYDVTGHDEYIVHDSNALVAPRDKDDQVLEFINTLKQDLSKLEDLKSTAISTAQSWPSWEESSLVFYEAISTVVEQERISNQQQVKQMAAFFFDWYVVAEEYKKQRILKMENSKIATKTKGYIRKNHPAFFGKLRKMKYKLKVKFKKK